MLSSFINKNTSLLLLFFICFFVTLPIYGKRVLPEEIELLANKHNIPIDSISIILQPLNSDTRLINLNAQIHRTPASVAKLFTAFVAMDHLGPDYHWTTEVFSTDNINDGVVDSLIFKGGGDPYITIERLDTMVLALRNLGITTINDGLIVEQSFFKQYQASTADFDNDPLRPYNIMHTSLLINSNTIDFKIKKYSNNTIKILPDFLPYGVFFRNELELGSGSCSQFRDNVQFTQIVEEQYPPNIVLLVDGYYPRNCFEFEHDLSLTDANHYFFGVFKNLWLKSGGSFNGYIREGKVPLSIKPIMTFDSPSLDKIIIEGVKESDNLIARNLFLSLNQSSDKNYRASRRIMRKVLNSNDVSITYNTFFENGSGLSRKTKVKPETILSLLIAIKQHPSSDIIMRSLPISGVDGTLENQYKTDLLRRRLKLKTGTLDGVSGLAGFITGVSGRDYAFVFLHNDIPDHPYKISSFREGLLSWVVNDI